MRRVTLTILMLCPLLLSGCALNTMLGGSANQNPTAVADAAPTEGVVPLIVTFDSTSSYDADGRIAEVLWECGDPQAAGVIPASACEHTYSEPGTYLAKLTIIDDDGAVDSKRVAIIVRNAPPVAQASVSSESPLPGSTVLFDGTASYDLHDQIESYIWSFGDGGTASGPTVEHAYVRGGDHLVTLTVTDDEGLSASTGFVLTVLPGFSRCTEPPSSSAGCAQ
jgi:PKD repeat protein